MDGLVLPALLVGALLVLDVMALRYGADTRDARIDPRAQDHPSGLTSH